MLNTFLIIINLQIFLYASNQIILVVSDDFNAKKAKLRCFEAKKQVFKTTDVNLGKNGLAWGISHLEIKHDLNEPQKVEGDKKAPIGIFKLSKVFGYAKSNTTNMPYMQATQNLICVDDAKHKNYNQIIQMPNIQPKSFEYMKRQDKQYELGIVVQHNSIGKKNAGSCIFIHVQKHKDAPTAGCTSMKYEDLQRVVEWLDKDKNPILIQVPKQYLDEVKSLYPELPLD